MTKRKDPYALEFNEDFPIVIFGAHMELKDAVELAEHDIGDVELYKGKCKAIKHIWARYGFVNEWDCDWDVEPGDKAWTLIFSKDRPKGIVIKVTLLEFE